jgi:hypothetical protein
VTGGETVNWDSPFAQKVVKVHQVWVFLFAFERSPSRALSQSEAVPSLKLYPA